MISGSLTATSESSRANGASSSLSDSQPLKGEDLVIRSRMGRRADSKALSHNLPERCEDAPKNRRAMAPLRTRMS